MSLTRATFAALLFAGTTAGVVLGAVHAMDVAGTPRPAVGSSLMLAVVPELKELGRADRRSGTRHVVFLGDSISIRTTGASRPVPELLRRRLEGAPGRPVEIHSLAALGTGPFDYYFLADEIAAAGPDRVVIAFSLNAFGESFRKLSRTQISGWLGRERLVEAAGMPTHWIGLTYDELLMNAGIVGTGGFAAWNALAVEQARLGAAREDLARWLGARFGGRGPQTFQLARFTHDRDRTRVPGFDRYTHASELRHYGPVLTGLDADHPVLEVLSGAVRRLRERGVSTLVYVNPINIEHLQAVGVLPSEELTRSLGLVRAAVEGAGGELLDLHALLPDAAFRDAAGHFGGEDVDGTGAIASAVAEQIRLER